MIQDIFPHKLDTTYTLKKPKDDSIIVIMKNYNILLKKEDSKITLPTFKEFGSAVLTRYIFSIDDKEFFLVDSSHYNDEIDLLMNSGYIFFDIQKLRKVEPKWLRYGAVTATHLWDWYDSNRYCGKCGNQMKHAKDERRLFCDCGNFVFPKIAPAIITGVIDGDKILITKYCDNIRTRYALIAGYTEVGETIEETVRREVMEEVGIKVKNIRYYKSQPWAFSDTLLLGFFCELDGSNEIKINKSELSFGEWISREELKKMNIKDDGVSLTYDMMAKFINEEI